MRFALRRMERRGRIPDGKKGGLAGYGFSCDPPVPVATVGVVSEAWDHGGRWLRERDEDVGLGRAAVAPADLPCHPVRDFVNWRHRQLRSAPRCTSTQPVQEERAPHLNLMIESQDPACP
ncbi:MAG: hypothetical protein M3Q71_10050 [Chloroflexota bacterium]|nr:hypothetical protein [Chloroflexota bacterium]MDP9470992.1 hypothetical protein [Chloroflexota bacterium]